MVAATLTAAPTCARGCGAPRLPTHAYCREHRNEAARLYRARNPAKVKLRNRAAVLRLRGLTQDEYDQILEDQGGCCAACREHLSNKPRQVHVDHCHVTGKVRGVLCCWCNVALGHAKDDPARLRALASYVEYHRGGDE